MILLDEYNKFRFLSAFIRPIDDLGSGLERYSSSLCGGNEKPKLTLLLLD